ncbi:MAG: T9SS type A sorting domain-containing protein [bacterium]
MKTLLLAVFYLLISCVYTADAVHISSTPPATNYTADGLILTKFGHTAPQNPLDNWSATVNAPILASPKFADLTGDNVTEILLTTYGTVNPYSEGWLHAWDGAGNALPNYPLHLTGAAPGTPAIGDLDGDGDVEIVQGTWNYLYVFNAIGTSFPNWPISLYVTQAAALEDLDGNGDLEIIVPSSTTMRVYNHDTSVFPGFPVSGAHDLTAAAVGDLEGDGDLEIVAGSFVASGSASDYVYAWHHNGSPVSGFPVTTAGSVKVPPALVDLDGDGTLEIVADCWSQTGTDFLYVWSHMGQPEPGWPLNIAYIRLSSPSVADLDGDGDLEIIVGGMSSSPPGEKVYAYHHDATPVAGFPVVLPNSSYGNVNSTCTVGNIDGDDYPEIVIKAVNYIFALNHDGSTVAGFPVPLSDENHSGTTSPSPAIGDPDGDGWAEIFAASCYNNVMLMDQAGAFTAALNYWPTYRQDAWNRGLYEPLGFPSVVVTLTPYGTPIVIPAAGGSFDFNIAIVNNESSSQRCDVWCDVTLPNGQTYGPVIGPVALTITGGAEIERDRTQNVPGNARPGTYSYHANVGSYPTTLWSSDSFDFEKLGMGDDNAGDWNNWGELLNEMGMADANLGTLPLESRVGTCFPNPFNAETSLPIELPEPAQVKITLYDLLGETVQVVFNGECSAGYQHIHFAADHLPAGIYFYRVQMIGLNTGGTIQAAGKMALVK